MGELIGFIEIVAGGLGVAFGLGGLARLRRHPPRGPGDRASAVGLIIFGVLLVLMGAFQWITGQVIV